MKLQEAKEIAEKLVEQLRPYCERIQIAGSIRRCKPEVKDIEIVCIPIERNGSRCDGFVQVLEAMQSVKGSAKTGKYTQRITPEGIKLDLFTARKENWGFILSQRTGSADYSHHVLAKGWVKKGYRSVDTILVKGGVKYPAYEEEDIFKMAGVEYVEPKDRCYNHVEKEVEA